jgi:SAM-dependent methyltransferase
MGNVELVDDYELHYWKVHKGEKYNRVDVMINMFPNLRKHKIVADIGCGPLCGIFHKLKFEKMFAVDPLWDEYEKNGLIVTSKNVIRIKNNAQTFKLDEKPDLIVSFNAMDHSGNLKKSIDNIMKNLSSDGRFCFHVHMRTKAQLNRGHQMLITENMLDSILSKYNVVSRQVCKDPLDPSRKYMSYIAEVRHG